MLVSAVAFAFLWAVIRLASAEMHTTLVVFYRTLVGVLVLSPFLIRHGRTALKTSYFRLHLLRGISALIATYGVFYAVTVTPLADVVAISYTAPLFAALGAVFLLKEKIRIRRITAMIIGFLGVLIVIRPGLETVTPGVIAALVASVAIAGSLLTVKALSRTENARTIVAYAFLFVAPFSLAAAIPYWTWPDFHQLLLLIATGLLATLGQITLAKAFALSEATAVLPLDYIRLLIAAALGFMIFGERIDIWTVLGAALILVSTVYNAHREAKLAQIGRAG